MQYSFAQLEGLWIGAGGNRALAPLMAAIALAESRGDPAAENPSGASGLWQILGAVSPADQGQLFNPLVNAHEAVLKYQTQGLDAWETYTNGDYKQFLPAGIPAPQQVGTVIGGQVPQAGGLGGLVAGIWSVLQLPLSGLATSASDIAQGIIAVAAPLIKIAEAIDWFFHPAHWIRLLAGIGGGVLVLGGVWQMSHAGGA